MLRRSRFGFVSRHGGPSTEVRDELKAVHAELDAGVRTAQGYAAGAAVADWLAEGLPGRAARTVEVYRDALRPILDLLSARPTRRWSWSRTRVDPNQIACLELP